MVLKSISILAAGTLALVTSVAFAANPMVGGAAMMENKNIVENAMNSKDHTTLVSAVKAAGLADTLQGKGPFTVFAPTNAAFEKLPAGDPRHSLVAYIHARLGERSQALQMLDELKALSKQRSVSPSAFAIIYLGLGDKDQTFAWLEKAYEEHSPTILFLKVDPMWDPVRSDPRFADLLRRMGLPP